MKNVMKTRNLLQLVKHEHQFGVMVMRDIRWRPRSGQKTNN